MPLIFAYGTLRHLPLLEIVAGEPVTPRPATLPGFAVKQASGADFPVIVAEEGAAAEGIVCEVGAAALERLDWYEMISDYPGVDREVRTEGGPVVARVWMPGERQRHEDAAWHLDEWVAGWGDVLCRAAAEAMLLHGRVPVAQIARYWQTFLVRADSARRAAAMAAPRLGTPTEASSVEVLASEATHAGYFITRTERLRHPTFAGGMSPEIDRETYVMGDACVVLPYDPVRDRVLLTEQFRLGPWCRGARYPWVLEPPAGRIDPGETPEACARRECVEETGAELGELLKVAEYYPCTGGVSEYVYTYVGLCDLPDLPEGGGGLDAEGEDIRTLLLSFDEAMDIVSGGEANDGPLILLMLWLQRERPRLRAPA